MEKVSVIITIKDAEQELPELLQSLEMQVRQPDEVIISDASENEKCQRVLKNWKPDFHVKILRVSGNRSVGRNKAIENALHPIIAITDAGCIPDKKWLQRLVKPFRSSEVQIVSGFTLPRARTIWQEVGGAYFLVMPEKILSTYLPATRSMALRKKIWEDLGKFPEHLEVSEDYEFAQRARAKKIPMKFVSDAIVEWIPPSSLAEIGRAVYKFAWWDMSGGVLRIKTISIFLRYVVFLILLIWLWPLGLIALFSYSIWAWRKNAEYVRWPASLVVLPITQFFTDGLIMIATMRAFFHARKRKTYSAVVGDK